MSALTFDIPAESDMEAFGARLAPALRAGDVLHIRGVLGAGKTTLVRGVLRGLGLRGAVKSPTFTLVEPYSFGAFTLNHFDLYRLKSAEELEFMGIRDYLRGADVCLIEWPERGENVLPEPDVDVMIAPVHRGRTVSLTAHRPRGDAILRGLAT